MKREILIFVTFSTLVCGSAADDVEQKKRGAGKAGNFNSISTEVQKPDYNYNIYSSQSSSTYQPPNSYYPNQANQYYSSGNSNSEQSSYQPQQINAPQNPSQLTAVNYIPNQGYQSKYQFVPSKSQNGNIQFAILQPNSFPSPVVHYQPLFSPSPVSHINPHQHPMLTPITSHSTFPPSFQPLPLGGSYVGPSSGMVLLAHSSPNLYNNLLYPNPIQSFYNYYPSNSQAKYSMNYGASPQVSTEYEKVPGQIAQGVPKEDNEVNVQANDYVSSDSSVSYKNNYSGNRSPYTKLN